MHELNPNIHYIFYFVEDTFAITSVILAPSSSHLNSIHIKV